MTARIPPEVSHVPNHHSLPPTPLGAEHRSQAEVGDLLVITFSAQGAPVAQGQAEVRALRDAMLKVRHGGTAGVPWCQGGSTSPGGSPKALKSSDFRPVLRGKSKGRRAYAVVTNGMTEHHLLELLLRKCFPDGYIHTFSSAGRTPMSFHTLLTTAQVLFCLRVIKLRRPGRCHHDEMTSAATKI